jgi:dihydropteroate synthase
MGVLNITPDSFSDGGRFLHDNDLKLGTVLDAAMAMVEAGADVLDIGGESTRPGAAPVSESEELKRVIPVLQALQGLDIILSVDTRHAAVADMAVQAGAHMINDVSAGEDAEMFSRLAPSDVALVLMHMRGTPRTMQQNPIYADVVGEVSSYLAERLAAAQQAGIGADRIMLDPGFGFGKTIDHNLALLSEIEALRANDRPILAGLSRKSMLGQITGADAQHRLGASIGAAMLAVLNGADMVRVHDVAETHQALQVLGAVKGHKVL